MVLSLLFPTYSSQTITKSICDMKKDHRQPTTYFTNTSKDKLKNRRDSGDIVESIFNGDYQGAKSKMYNSLFNRLEQKQALQKSMMKGGERMQNHIFNWIPLLHKSVGVWFAPIGRSQYNKEEVVG